MICWYATRTRLVPTVGRSLFCLLPLHDRDCILLRELGIDMLPSHTQELQSFWPFTTYLDSFVSKALLAPDLTDELRQHQHYFLSSSDAVITPTILANCWPMHSIHPRHHLHVLEYLKMHSRQLLWLWWTTLGERSTWSWPQWVVCLCHHALATSAGEGVYPESSQAHMLCS